MRRIASWIAGWIAGTAVALALSGAPARAADPFIADGATDTGAEPNAGASTTISPDIWVRRTPDPNFSPVPYAAASPTWTPQPHQNARYADPRLSAPNWVYVKVRNRGAGATPAGARLTLYWTKVGSAQAWPTAWVDYLPGTGELAHGMEITKPRRNAATVTQAERDAYVQAILAIDAAGHAFPDGVTFWDKQNQIHSSGMVMPVAHGNPAFLPWHREFVNRYEALLQTADPRVKLLYWDWTRDPRRPIDGVSIFTTAFMGAIGAGTTTPIGAPFEPLMTPVQAVRNSRPANVAFASRSDATILGRAQYNDLTGNTGLRTAMEGGNYHNRTHVDIGGPQPSTCAAQPATCILALSWVQQAARDPFFFMLHGNVDRLWAQWQRADPARYDVRAGAAPYGLDSANVNITRTMPPWDGSAGLAPWTAGSPELQPKTSLDPSVVSPPIYDTAPLTLPVLQEGQEAIVQIPWSPPDPREFTSGAASRQSFALLARIETAATAPFGMTTPEGAGVAANIRNNNNIARRNVTVQDPVLVVAGAPAAEGRAAAAGTAAAGVETVAVANDFDALVMGALRAAPGSAPVEVKLPAELDARWRAEGARGEGLRSLPGGRVEIAPGGKLDGLPLKPGESFALETRVKGGVAELAQLGAPGDPARVVVRTEVEGEAAPTAEAAARGRGPAGPQFVRPGQSLTLGVEGLGAPGEIESVTFVIDGKEVETRAKPPFDLRWRAGRPGVHEVQIRARDKGGAVTTLTRVVTVAQNLPPQAQLLAPANEATFPLGAPIPVEAGASDPEGKLARVEFYLTPMAVFSDPVKVASVARPPFAATLDTVGAGMWMLSAVAVDASGAESQSAPIHFTVRP